MKVRIGISLGAAGAPGEFEAAVGLLEAAGVDSLWLPENVYGPSVEPFTGMTFALAKTERLKVGSGISVLPGRHPVLVAKQLASLAGLAPGRVLPVFGLQPALAAERALFPVPPGQRGAVFDEALTLLKLMLETDVVSFHGTFFTVENASVGPLPAKPLDIWLGGSAEQASREVEADHFGISLPVAFGGIPDALAASIRRRRPDADPAALIADGWAGASDLISRFVDAGLSKFVIRPAATPESFEDFVAAFASNLIPLQT
jgi:alkanesulfonate monooxygenase SsuD/methylene tetrahydromethanopterin reductase-like flavin-dependent oxidoreductase (luciferase family)